MMSRQRGLTRHDQPITVCPGWEKLVSFSRKGWCLWHITLVRFYDNKCRYNLWYHNYNYIYNIFWGGISWNPANETSNLGQCMATHFRKFKHIQRSGFATLHCTLSEPKAHSMYPPGCDEPAYNINKNCLNISKQSQTSLSALTVFARLFPITHLGSSAPVVA